jgi:hypothetical protein
MTNLSENEALFAFRRRIQSQALAHLVGKGIDIATVCRFRQSGTWTKPINAQVPQFVIEVINDPQHVSRGQLPVGPLIGIVKDNTRTIFDAAENLLTPDIELRRAIYRHFTHPTSESKSVPWILKSTQDLFKELRPKYLCDDENGWIDAGLILSNCVTEDFHVNLAGMVQSSIAEVDDSYQAYSYRVLRPTLASIQRVKPPVVDPKRQRSEVEERISDLVDNCPNLAAAVEAYLSFYAFLPLATPLSLGDLVSQWRTKYPNTNVWEELGAFTALDIHPLWLFHTCTALFKNIECVPPDKMDYLLMLARGIIEGNASIPDVHPAWLIRTNMQRHYQYHIESLTCGINGATVAAFACWLANLVVPAFGSDQQSLAETNNSLVSTELELSSHRWAIARSSTDPSPLREAILFSRSLWSDAVLVVLLRSLPNLEMLKNSAGMFESLQKHLGIALYQSRICASYGTSETFDFELSIDLTQAGITEGETGVGKLMLTSLTTPNKQSILPELLDGMNSSDNMLSTYCAVALRSIQFRSGVQDSLVTDFISNEKWRRDICHGATDVTLDATFSFVSEWQLRQTDDWFFNIPHAIAIECEACDDPDRREMLFALTALSSIAVDSASPIQRLLQGERRSEFLNLGEAWSKKLEGLARYSAPWLKSRVRSICGTLGLALG